MSVNKVFIIGRLGRKIASSNELTKAEISEMIEVLNNGREAA